jgi:hypothetical protein
MQTSLLRHRVSHDAEDADGSKDDAGAEARADRNSAHPTTGAHSGEAGSFEPDSCMSFDRRGVPL